MEGRDEVRHGRKERDGNVGKGRYRREGSGKAWKGGKGGYGREG